MGATGTVDLDFGAWPGKYDTTVAVTGQAGIVAGSLVEAWIRPEATADHSVDEHIMAVAFVRVVAGNIVGGTGFTIYGLMTDPGEQGVGGIDGNFNNIPRKSPRGVGKFKVAWAWL
jgi:hypothetical protein